MSTVEQLIARLQEVKDKSAEVIFDASIADYELANVEDHSDTATMVCLTGRKIRG